MVDGAAPARRGRSVATSMGLGFADLFSPPLLTILLTTLVLNLALLVGLWFGIDWLLTETTVTEIGWLEWVIDVAGGFAAIVLMLILFPVLATMILSFFLDAAAGRVARRHYPEIEPGRDQPIAEAIGGALRFLAVVILVNLVALPVYLLVPALNLALFYVVNGYLFGREYFELVAARYLSNRDAAAMRGRQRGRLFGAGVLITLSVRRWTSPTSAGWRGARHGRSSSIRSAARRCASTGRSASSTRPRTARCRSSF